MRFVLALGSQPVEDTSSPCKRSAWSVPSSALETSSAVRVVRPAGHSPVPTGPASKKTVFPAILALGSLILVITALGISRHNIHGLGQN